MDMPSYESCGKGSCSPVPAWNGRAAIISTIRCLMTTGIAEANDLVGCRRRDLHRGLRPLRDEGRAYADRLSAAGVNHPSQFDR
jgi:hypothetical protein